MKVLYVSKASRVAAHREKLAVLSDRVELTLVTPRGWGRAPWEEAPFDGLFDVHRLPGLFEGHNHFHAYRGLGPVLARGFDLIHVDEEPYSLVTAQLARLARRSGVPFVFFGWQNLAKRLPPPFGVLRRRVFGAAAGGIAGTEGAARVIRAGGFPGPLLVSPQMGVSVERFGPDPAGRRERRRELGLADDVPLVGFVGRLVPEKGADLVIRALGALPGVHLVLVGDGPEREALGERALRSGVSDRVHEVGGVPSLSVPGWMAALDALALPSRGTSGWTEQFGRVLVEAMATGVPVVASDSGEMSQVVGDAGWIVPEGSVEGLVVALRAALDGPEGEERGRRGRRRVLERFTHERIVDDQVAFYERLGGRTGSGVRGASVPGLGAAP